MLKFIKGAPLSGVVGLLLIGVVIGIGTIFAYEYTMEATSTDEFCTSCHVMAAGPFTMLQETTHFRNESGVRPGCADCHVPESGWPKIWRKIQASREVWSHITGKIDTPEKYLAHVDVMKGREIARLKANDSQECRNCHNVDAMDFEQQSRMAKRAHSRMQGGDRTCIDCHDGIAHDKAALDKLVGQNSSPSKDSL